MRPIEIHPALEGLFQPWRYKIVYGGRGSGKSTSVCRALAVLTSQEENHIGQIPLRVHCCREIQKSINRSSRSAFESECRKMKLDDKYSMHDHFIFKREEIVNKDTGALITFSGLSDITSSSIRSMDGVHILWCEEAQNISKRSLDEALPTIREIGSEVWFTMNPRLASDPVYKMILDKPPDAFIKKINWDTNPWWNETQENERLRFLRDETDDYAHHYEGECKSALDGAIYTRQINALEQSGRLCDVRHNPHNLVHCAFDPGDHWMTCVVFQVINRTGQINILNYISVEDSPTWDFFNQELRSMKGYSWGFCFLPHDGNHPSRKVGLSDVQIMQNFGWDVRKLERTSNIEKDIRLIKMRFQDVVISTQAAELLEQLRCYRRHTSKATGYIGGPIHDEASHGADAFRYMHMAVPILENEMSFMDKNRRHDLWPLQDSIEESYTTILDPETGY